MSRQTFVMPSATTALSTHAPEPCVLMIYGASGDLTHRKLIPSLYDLHRQGVLPKGMCVMGVSRTPMSDEEFRGKCEPSAQKFAADFKKATWDDFAQRVFYHSADGADPAAYKGISQRVSTLAAERGIMRGGGGGGSGMPNILFYLSVSPNLYEPIIESIGSSGLVAEGKRWCSLNPHDCSWQRIVVEKPFGSDLESAESLNRCLGRVFEEDSIFRIDHYLGKELVQNILVMRMANTIFEPVWNRNFVDHVQVTAAETVGVGSRAANYYDSGAGGALRDMVQSHLLQVLALVAMEPPSVYDAAAIMREKIKLFNSAIIDTPQEAARHAVFGRYGEDKAKNEPAYVNEKGVDAGRKTETFAAIRLNFDNWRWNGVPFFLRSGKKMSSKLTEVVVQFREPPTDIFRRLSPNGQSVQRPGNRIIMNIAPTEGISLSIAGKVPGGGVKIASAKLDLDYAEAFGGEAIEAYGPLILDAMRGDRTLYKHRDEVESSWRICQPFLDSVAVRSGIEEYAAGSWGPDGADRLISADSPRRHWHNPEADEVR